MSPLKPHAVWRIPKGFRPKAPGCEERATWGRMAVNINNPNGVAALLAAKTTQPRWGRNILRACTQCSFVPRNPGLRDTIPLETSAKVGAPSTCSARRWYSFETRAVAKSNFRKTCLSQRSPLGLKVRYGTAAASMLDNLSMHSRATRRRSSRSASLNPSGSNRYR